LIELSIDTVIFDMDGVILDTEQVWNAVRHDFAVTHGGRWSKDDQRAVMGANSLQWAAYMRKRCGVDLQDGEIYSGVVRELREAYARDLPLIAGGREAVEGLARAYRLGVASSSPRELIEYALGLAGLGGLFAAVVSSDEVSRGKPEPDVYREACARLGAAPRRSAAVEDSSNGIQAAAGAGLAVVAIPNRAFPPSGAAIQSADVVLGSIVELTPAVVASIRREAGRGE
jgi:HAD superfamily hydrolase (TIGR01509 family)